MADQPTTEQARTTDECSEVRCQNCGELIGHYIEWNGAVVIRMIGGVKLDNAWGWCGKCGERWIWHQSDKPFGRLIERLERRAKEREDYYHANAG